MKYTVDYFLNKFDAIPDEEWTRISCINELGQRCALGHCGQASTGSHLNEESAALGRKLKKLYSHKITLRESVYGINDAEDANYGDDSHYLLGDTPKERIMNALMLVKAGVKL